MNYRKMLITLMLGALAACQGPAGENGAEGPAGEKGPQGEQGVAGDNGTNGQDLAAPAAAIASVAPNALLVGRTTTVRIVGYFTEWDETTTVRLTDMEDADIEGVEVATVVASSVGIVATVTVAADVALGAVKLHVITGDNALAYMPEGASVTVTATATSSQGEIRAGDNFDILIETAEYMSSPTLNGENCVGVLGASMARYSQFKFRVTGLMHPATTLGDCAMVLEQDAETDDAWSSAVVVTITAPDVTTFNEGVTSGELTPERKFRIVAVAAEANEVVALRHTVDTDNNLDGTGPEILVFVEGNLTAVAQHDGSDRWLEVSSVEARELLVVVQDNSLAEGDEPTSFNLSLISPNTTMTALQDGATQDQRLPANEDGANEAGRGSWYTITNESAVWTTLTIAPADETTLQSTFVMIKDDEVVGSGSTSWEGVLEAGTYVLGVRDQTQSETDGILSFGVQLSRTALLGVDENGAATGTLQTDATDSYLVTVPEGHVASFSATRGDNNDVAMSATWVGADEAVAQGTNRLVVPSAAGGQLLVRLSAEGDLAEGAAYTVAFSTVEAAVLDIENGNEGSAPENGSVWYMGTLEGSAIVDLTVTPGTADHLQTTMGLYTGNGAAIMGGGDSIRTLVSGTFFVSVGDAEFVADQDQTFTLATSTDTNPANVACYAVPSLNVGDTERGEFSIQADVSTSTDFYPRNTARDAVFSITLAAAASIDLYTIAGWDTVLYVHPACGENWGTALASNDDGSDWNGNPLPNYNSGINNLSLPAGTSYVVITAYSRWSRVGPVELRYRLRDAQ